MSRTIKDATVKRLHDEAMTSSQHLADVANSKIP